MGAGVVGGEAQLITDPPRRTLHEVADLVGEEIAAHADRLSRVEQLGAVEGSQTHAAGQPASRLRHDLHQTDGAGARDRVLVEEALLADHRQDEVGVDGGLAGRRGHLLPVVARIQIGNLAAVLFGREDPHRQDQGAVQDAGLLVVVADDAQRRRIARVQALGAHELGLRVRAHAQDTQQTGAFEVVVTGQLRRPRGRRAPSDAPRLAA